MFKQLEDINGKPEPYEFYTAADLWTGKHTSEQMLACHLNPGIDVSSRRGSFIDKSVAWIGSHFNVGGGTRIADFGCGPGLYANRLAKCGARVTGIDFSERSINYARGEAERSGLSVEYINQRQEAHSCEENLQNGFWSADKYYGFLNTFKYDDAKVVLDKYTIVEAERTRTVYNWLQYFSSGSLLGEFGEAGFMHNELHGNVAGDPFDESAPEFAIIARV